MLGTADTIVIVAYFMVAMGLGILLKRKAGRGLDDYFLAGRSAPWWVLGASGSASNFDMTGTMIMVSFVFAVGLQGFWVAMRGGIGLPLGLLLVYMAKWLRRSNVMTSAEWMEFRFGSGRQGQAARVLSAVANLIVTVAFLTYFVEGTGKFLSVFLGLRPELCSTILIAVAMIYTTLSGLYGVLFTDAAQELLMIVTALYVGYEAFALPDHAEVIARAGERWSSFVPAWEAAPMTWMAAPDMYHFFGLTIVFWIARGLFEGAGGFTGGYIPQRYYAARNEREAGLMTAEWIFLLLFRWALIVGIAVLGLSLVQSDSGLAARLNGDPEKVLPTVIARLIPVGFKGLTIAGLIAAAMSTFDSTVNAGASYWVRDIYQRYIFPEAGSKQLLRQSYAASLLLSAGAAAVGYFIPSIESIWGWITGPLSAGLFAPIILRWYWARFNGYGFAASTAVGLVFAIVLKIVAPGMPLFVSFPLVWTASLAAAVLVSLSTEPTDDEVLRHFWKTVRPFGFWTRIKSFLAPRQIADSKKESARDMLNVPVAVAWHMSAVVSVISFMLHKWDTLTVAFLIWTAASLKLYFSWYRNLAK